MATTCELIAEVSLGSDAASIEFTGIPSTYDDLYLVYSIRATRSSVVDVLLLQFNGSSSSLSGRYIRGSGSAASSAAPTTAGYAGLICGDTATANTFGNGEVYVPNYAGSTNKSWSASSVTENNATEAYIEADAGLWANTAAVTSLALIPNNGPNLKTGSSAYLYGITKS